MIKDFDLKGWTCFSERRNSRSDMSADKKWMVKFGTQFAPMTLESLEKEMEVTKKALEIGGVLSNVYSWRYRGDEGAQVDLVIDRRDNVINLCEIKFSSSEYVIDKAYSKELKHKRDVFKEQTKTSKEQTKTRKAVHLTMITTEGVKRNVYFNDIQSEVTLDQLFID